MIFTKKIISAFDQSPITGIMKTATKEKPWSVWNMIKLCYVSGYNAA